MAKITRKPDGTPEVSHRPRGANERVKRTGYLFIAPFYAVFLGFLVLPLLYAAYLSVFREQIVGGTTFIGLRNYATALSDPRLLDGIVTVAKFFLIQVPIMLILALLFALALDSGLLAAARVFRLGIFLPYAVPSVVAALMWGYIYGPRYGPFAQLADAIGVSAPQFLDQNYVLGSIANIVTWEFVGYNMIIMYAALRAIPSELYEAAAMDGAGQWRIAWSIKIPAIRPAIFLTLIFSIIGSFQLFNEPNLLQRLAPAAIDSAFTPNLYAYSLAFTGQNINYAAAVSFMLGLTIVIISYVVQFVLRRGSRS